MKVLVTAAMKAKSTINLTLVFVSFILQTMLINIANANDDEVDADFLEFLAEMEEVTGSGFDSWLNDGDIDKNEDHFSTNTNEEIDSTELQK